MISSKLKEKEIDIELVAAFAFIVVAASYILNKFGVESLVDALFLWMFPASVMIFLTLLIVKIFEKFHRK